MSGTLDWSSAEKTKRKARARGGSVGDKKRQDLVGETTAIAAYLDNLRDFPQLKHPEVIELFKAFEAGVTWTGEDEKRKIATMTPSAKRARERLITCNLRLVVSIAKQYRNTNIPIEDLIQEGNEGLMKAVERFTWQKGFKFSTYATWWIRQKIGQHVLKRKRIIRLPAHAASVQRELLQATEKFRDETGFEPSVEELMGVIDASEAVVKATIQVGRGTVSLQQPVSASGEGDTLEDKIEDDRPGANPFENVAEKELIEIARRVLNSLSAKEAAILRLRFGLVEDATDSETYPITEAEFAAVKEGFGLT